MSIKVKEFHDELFNNTIVLLIGKHSEYIDYVLKRFDCEFENTDKSSAGETSHHNLEGHNHIVIWLQALTTRPERLSALVHESVHAANFIMINAGIKVDGSNDELAAYLTEWIFINALRR